MGSETNWLPILYLLGALVLVAPVLLRVFRSGKTLQYVVIWLAIVVVIGLAYRFVIAPEQFAPTPPYDPAGPSRPA